MVERFNIKCAYAGCMSHDECCLLPSVTKSQLISLELSSCQSSRLKRLQVYISSLAVCPQPERGGLMLPLLKLACIHGTVFGPWTRRAQSLMDLSGANHLPASRTVSKQGDGSQQCGIVPGGFLKVGLLT